MTAPAAIPRWTPDVEDVFDRALRYSLVVQSALDALVMFGTPIHAGHASLLRCARNLFEGAQALRHVDDVEQRQSLVKALLLADDAFFSDEAAEEQDDPAYYDGGE